MDRWFPFQHRSGAGEQASVRLLLLITGATLVCAAVMGGSLLVVGDVAGEAERFLITGVAVAFLPWLLRWLRQPRLVVAGYGLFITLLSALTAAQLGGIDNRALIWWPLILVTITILAGNAAGLLLLCAQLTVAVVLLKSWGGTDASFITFLGATLLALGVGLLANCARFLYERQNRMDQRRGRLGLRSQILASAIVTGSREAIMSVDPQGRVTSWNLAAERLFGYRADEIVGKPVTTLHAAEGEGMMPLWPAGGDPERPVTYLAKRRHRLGTELEVEMTVSPLRAPNGSSIGASCLFREVGERRRYERELVKTREEARTALQVRSAFLATVSHEIRTPMNSILGMAELLNETELSGSQKHYVDLLQKAGEGLLTLINDILDYSRIESGRLDLTVDWMDLGRLLLEHRELMSGVAKTRVITLDYRILSPEGQEVRADRVRLQQVLNNLVGNALKFTPKGGVVTVTLTEEGNRQVIQVRDTGVGIPAAHRGRIFEAFSQGDPSVTRQFGGTGLGLAITRRLVEAMAGEIGFESEEGKGSLFWVNIPFERRQGSGVAVQAAPAPLPAPVPVPAPLPELAKALPRDAQRILVVDDTEENRFLVERFLTKEGYYVATAQDGLEAFEAIERSYSEGMLPYGAILMDLQMPRMDGFTAVKKIREREREASGRGHLPVIALTAHVMEEELRRCAEAGFDAHVTKPVSRQALAELLRKFLGAKAS